LILATFGNGCKLIYSDQESRVSHPSKGVEKLVFFTGNVNNVKDYLSESDVFILPSLSEGTPMALLEAMASGLAIVATRVGENEIALDHGRAGFLIPPASVEDLSSILNNIFSDREIFRKMGEEAHKLANQKFSSQGMIKKYEELYLGLFQNKYTVRIIFGDEDLQSQVQ